MPTPSRLKQSPKQLSFSQSSSSERRKFQKGGEGGMAYQALQSCRVLNHSQSKRVRVGLKMSEIISKITILHQGVTYISLCYCELYCTLQLPFYYSLEPLLEDQTGGMVLHGLASLIVRMLDNLPHKLIFRLACRGTAMLLAGAVYLRVLSRRSRSVEITALA